MDVRNVVHSSFNNMFRSLNGEKDPISVYLTMLVFCTVHTGAQSRHHAYQKRLLNINPDFAKVGLISIPFWNKQYAEFDNVHASNIAMQWAKYFLKDPIQSVPHEKSENSNILSKILN